MRVPLPTGQQPTEGTPGRRKSTVLNHGSNESAGILRHRFPEERGRGCVLVSMVLSMTPPSADKAGTALRVALSADRGDKDVSSLLQVEETDARGKQDSIFPGRTAVDSWSALPRRGTKRLTRHRSVRPFKFVSRRSALTNPALSKHKTTKITNKIPSRQKKVTDASSPPHDSDPQQ